MTHAGFDATASRIASIRCFVLAGPPADESRVALAIAQPGAALATNLTIGCAAIHKSRQRRKQRQVFACNHMLNFLGHTNTVLERFLGSGP